MVYRFVHAADIHLDSPLKSLALRDPDLAGLVGDATRRALVNIVDLCIEEQVDALLLAGDLYDGDQTSMKTARFLADQIRRLHVAGIEVYVIRGNHDAISRITRELMFPESVKVFGGRADVIEVERPGGSFPVAIHGLSFAQSHAPESLLGKYRSPVEGAVNIGLMHTSLGGASGHDRYAPCSAGDLGAAGFHYWALGHIHKRSVTEGACAIVMPGMPQGRDIGEAGPKSVTLVTVGDDRSISLEERLTSVAEFDRIEVDVSGAEDWRGVVLAIEKKLATVRERARSQHLVARLSVSGATPLAWRIRRDADMLKAEADDRASGIGRTWIEKLDIACTMPESGAVQPGDPLTELDRLIAEEIMVDPAYEAALIEIAEELRGQLPAECRDMFGDDEATFRGVLAELGREGAEEVLARLRPAGEEKVQA
ncbi:serine/threonine phosphatase [Mesorhizobium sp. L-8-10]|uniref:metallophosphoesterase family protein n=1 Tax=unclassified Mesorhizobium TaxID=325217 RepID=UPI0019261719|nr:MULTISPECIES: DNA repair exonuclease [unclassified Mesorhizobium]BCH25893.1 serine/threonine phosphatase [Mesorhizobium sp. L-8-3]BCH33877.1 serine/threonine phosphatase [Mesorhizobium sp. L-8-10]